MALAGWSEARTGQQEKQASRLLDLSTTSPNSSEISSGKAIPHSCSGESIFPSWLLVSTWGAGEGRGALQICVMSPAPAPRTLWAVLMLTSWAEPVWSRWLDFSSCQTIGLGIQLSCHKGGKAFSPTQERRGKAWTHRFAHSNLLSFSGRTKKPAQQLVDCTQP